MKKNDDQVRELRREVRELRRLLTRLACAVEKHTRTDLAPDAALPAMRALVAELRKRNRP